jgi:hypothetical protein
MEKSPLGRYLVLMIRFDAFLCLSKEDRLKGDLSDGFHWATSQFPTYSEEILACQSKLT